MQVVPEQMLDDVMGWLTSLPYPWCTPEQACEHMPLAPGLEAVRACISSTVAAAA